MLEDSLPISDDSRKKRGCCCSLIYFICCLWEAKNRMGSIHFPMPAWGWWHGCHWLLLSLMGLHYNGASESKSPRRRWAVCLADRLWCKRLVISCYSKQHNCLVKGEWRQIDLSMFRLCRMCFHGVHPWNEHVYSSTSERSRRGQYHLPAQKGTDVKKKKASSDCAVAPRCVADQDKCFHCLCLFLCCCLLIHSSILFLCASFPSATMVLTCLVNLCWSPQIFRLTWLTSGVCSKGNSFFFSPPWWMLLGADPCLCFRGGVSLCFASV